MKLKRIIYLGYYIKQLDRQKFSSFLEYTIHHTKKSRIFFLWDLLQSILRYNISILEYFQFRFYELDEKERSKWAGTGYMYEYQLIMNPRSKRHILDDKTLFYKNYGKYFVHKVADIEDLKSKSGLADRILSNSSGKLVFKVSDGKCGAQVEIKKYDNFDRRSLISYMEDNNYGLVEEFIQQHPEINRLSPSAVNTIRVITQLNENGEVDILGCRMRISVNSPVDNMAAGNLATPIDEDTGRLIGPAVYSDITKSDCEVHPVSNITISGYQIPFWNETIDMVKKAALEHPQNRSIGWDVVVTENGPGLIEGNHDWCKLLWQLPIKRGMKRILNDYKESYTKTFST